MVIQVKLPEKLMLELEQTASMAQGMSNSELIFPEHQVFMECRELLLSKMDWQSQRLVGPMLLDLKAQTITCHCVPKGKK